MQQSRWIYDVGMHNGNDTAYYLHKGLRVVAIEANPIFCKEAASRFSAEVTDERLRILNVEITTADEPLDFWICDTVSEWSSFHKEIASRNDSAHHAIRVPCVKFASILEEHGVPRFMKIDIEGNDGICLDDLKIGDIPKYLSIEGDNRITNIDKLKMLEYTKFKLISQSHFLPLQLPQADEVSCFLKRRWIIQGKGLATRVLRRLVGIDRARRFANPTRVDGDWYFPRGSSGAIGENVPGRWLDYDDIVRVHGAMLPRIESRESSLFRGDSSFSFWHDVHATW